MVKGQIFWAKNKKEHKHPIVFIERIDNEKFAACILSTKSTGDNIVMNPEHFHKLQTDGSPYNIFFNKSHLVQSMIFIKQVSWLETINPEGMLTETGIKFIESKLDGLTPKYVKCSIKDYYNNSK